MLVPCHFRDNLIKLGNQHHLTSVMQTGSSVMSL